MGIMSIVKNVIEHFRKAGKTENENCAIRKDAQIAKTRITGVKCTVCL